MSRKLETLADLNVGDYLWFEGGLNRVQEVEEGEGNLWHITFNDDFPIETFEDGPGWLIADDAEIAELRRHEVLHFRAAARMWFAMVEAREGSRRACAAVGLTV